MKCFRKVLLELIEVSVIGLIEKLRSEGVTKESFGTVNHITSLIKIVPIEHERNVLGEALVQLVKETPTPEILTKEISERWLERSKPEKEQEPPNVGKKGVQDEQSK